MRLARIQHYVALFLLAGCIDPYKPPAVSNDLRLLIVDGFLNTTTGAIEVKLSRSNSPSVAELPGPELNASVFVTSGEANRWDLHPSDSGKYTLYGITAPNKTKYQLHVITDDGDVYTSEEIEAKDSPAIDSVYWKPADTGVNIYVDTHDLSGNSKYYFWDYVETWEYFSPYSSDFKSLGNKIVQRDSSEKISTCWHNAQNPKIYVTTTKGLSTDGVRNFELKFIPKESNRISVKYSINVRQRSISPQEFEYYGQLAKTTESQGGLFDPLPSRVLGNIQGNGSAPVLGYFSCGGLREKRMFIDHQDLPDRLQTPRDLMNCDRDTICVDGGPKVNCPFFDYNTPISVTVLSPIYKGIGIIGYFYSAKECGDCRTQGGTLEKPVFWPN